MATETEFNVFITLGNFFYCDVGIRNLLILSNYFTWNCIDTGNHSTLESLNLVQQKIYYPFHIVTYDRKGVELYTRISEDKWSFLPV